MQNVYEPILIEEGFWRIEEGGVRVFLIEGSEKAMLVDTGYGTGDLKACIASLTDKPIFVVNTHADGDHVGCNAQFSEIYMHPAEMDRYWQRNEETAKQTTVSPIWEGDTIDLGGKTFRVVLIPGHTPGSIALLYEEKGWLISGDSVQQGTIFMFGPGRNIYAYIESMRKLNALSGFTKILPSHGPFDVSREILPTLIEGAIKLKDNALTGRDPERDLPCLLYDYKDVHFLF
ncbi:MAG: MBL fold metallo-hydrolase [Christensenellaceae bacterium]|jgi:hydroxyacylglutathione hydrolase